MLDAAPHKPGTERRPAQGNTAALTAFVWSDTHFGYAQRPPGEDPRRLAIEQMNALPGRPYPAAVGGRVDTPAFVLHCGDTVDAASEPTSAFEFFESLCRELRWPRVETLGNHDGSRPFSDYFQRRYGGGCHTFDAGGIHWLTVDADYDADEKALIPDDRLAFIRADARALPPGTPTVLFTHASLNRIANTDAVLDALAGHHLILALAGHHHRPAVYRSSRTLHVDVGHCRDHPIDAVQGRSFTVLRISGGTIAAVPWRWDLDAWDPRGPWSPAAPDDAGAVILHTEQAPTPSTS